MKKQLTSLLNKQVLTAGAVLIVFLITLSLISNKIHAPNKAIDLALSKTKTKTFNARSHTLDNGLRVILIENHRAPVVTHMVWYKTGAANELDGQSGIAHFLEHLMFKGSAGLAPGEFSQKIRTLGGQDNAFTSQDFTAYYQSIASEHLETVMRMEAGRMRGLSPTPEAIESEREVIIEERKQRTDSNIKSRTYEQMRAMQFINHPYGTPVIGWEQEIKNLTWDQIKSFYGQYYGPNNATLVIAGDISPDHVLQLAQQIYGTIPQITPSARPKKTIPPLPSASHLFVTDPAVHQKSLSILVRLPSMVTNQNFALAMSILEDALSSGSTSRLYNGLVTEQKIATTINLSYRGNAINEAELWINATPANQVSLDDLKKAIIDEISALSQNPLSKSEITTSKSRLKKSAIFARDSLSGPAMVIGQSLTIGIDLDTIEYWPYLVDEITAQDISNAADTLIEALQENSQRNTMTYFTPAKTEKTGEE